MIVMIKITTPVRMVDHICNGKDNNSNNNERNGNEDNDNCNYYRIAQMGSVRLHTLRMEAASWKPSLVSATNHSSPVEIFLIFPNL